MTPDESRTIRRHLHSAEGAHIICRRKACRRARACRLIETCASRLYAAGGAGAADAELMALRMAYLLALLEHWTRLPRRPVAAARRRGRGEPQRSGAPGLPPPRSGIAERPVNHVRRFRPRQAAGPRDRAVFPGSF